MSETLLTENQIKELFEKAVKLHSEGQNDEALSLIERLLKLFPDAFLLHYNAGLIYFEKKIYSKALDHYNTALAEIDNEPNLVYNLALCHKKIKNYDKAISLFEQLITMGDTSEDVLYSLAGCHRETGNLELAAFLYQQILQKNDQHKSATNNLAYTYHRMGDIDSALAMYKKVVELVPSHKSAQHMIAALTGTTELDMEAQYVEELFDDYSETFEESLLGTLEYQVPKLLKKLLFETHQNCPDFKHALDIGCGTGLAAVELAPYCTHITGFDLAPKMVQKATEKGLYHTLVATDVTGFCQQTTEKYDLLVAADVFAYIGQLDTTFAELSTIAAPKATLAFTVEHLEDDQGSLKIRSTGRFAHSQKYITELAAANSMKLLQKTREKIRREGDTWIMGWLFVFEMKE